MNLWEKGVFLLTTALTGALLIRVWSIGLARVYKWFFCYFAWDFLTSLVLLYVPYNTKRYGQFYFSMQTVKILIGAFVVVEIYSLALERTPALAQFLRNAVGYILTAAAGIPVIWVLADSLKSSDAADTMIRVYGLFERTMDATMGIFLILISLFLAWFPVRLKRNAILYILGFIVWSLSRSAAAHLVIRFHGNLPVIAAISGVQMCLGLGCTLLWLIGLRREGEARTAVVGHLWNRAEADRLTSQLEAINDSLDRMRKR